LFTARIHSTAARLENPATVRSNVLFRLSQYKPSLAISVWLLGLTQIIGYGTLYYGFASLAEDMAASFRWPVFWIFGAFSLALLTSGLIAPQVGRRVDRHGAAQVMTFGSLAAAGSLAWTALAPNPLVFVAGLVAMQLASTLVFYDAAFAQLVQKGGSTSGRLITLLTLIAGFASTIFWPLTVSLKAWFSWREILVIFAGLNLAICAPTHFWLTRQHAHPTSLTEAHDGKSAPAHASDGSLPQELWPRAMFLVTWGFALTGFLLMAILAQMVPLLTAMGLGSASVMVSALFGPSQVVIRFANMTLGSGQHPLRVTLIMAVLLPLAALVLAFSAPSVAGAVVFATILGFASGLKSIVQGTLPLELFGRTGYATRLGKMAAVRLLLAAIAPFVLAYLMQLLGPSTALLLISSTGVLGLVALVEVARLNRVHAAARVRSQGHAEQAVFSSTDPPWRSAAPSASAHRQPQD
jgi:MFS family permease